ncbi:MAG: DEAD/DEAH box helicase family protein [Clostridia bacterium]|nr:DEAD/DEAH box helicase family protein [Clostridia bacterium]
MSKFMTSISKCNHNITKETLGIVTSIQEPEKLAIECRGTLGELIAFIYDRCGLSMPQSATMLELIDGRVIADFADNAVLLASLHFIRKAGMNAEHGLKVTKKEAQTAFENLVFFAQFTVRKFDSPETVKDLVLPKYMSEAETRKVYIDNYLREAGWEICEPNTTRTLADGQQVACGTIFPGKACCEIPVEGLPHGTGLGFCDYVLYGKDGKPLAIVEAKKTSEEALKGSEQVKQYGDCMLRQYGYVPVLYYTNGYDIFVIDGIYPARRVLAFHTADELTYMLQKRERGDITDLKVRDDISGRPYQKMAITSICERFNQKHRRGLIVMATGTGKTRVSISLVELLLRNGWVKNVLFLADRTSLVRQAFNNFRNILDDMTYCVLSDRSLANEPNARITFSTHQTMIGYIDAENKEFSSARFDLIIIDEAHRSVFNKYGAIFKYFDCLLVGLTATPKDEVDASTYQLFNCENSEPDFAYSLEEAVRDKYLVPFKVCPKTTQLLSHGIQYKDLSEDDKQKVESILVDEESPDESTVIGKEKLFKIIYNIDTCRKVLEDLMQNGLRVDYGQKLGKTIIFAYNHNHAKLIVDAFREIYPAYGENCCQLIDNQVKNANDLITKFEEDENFRIAVSVDMLDTGIDVPAVLNLVFFKPVKSKIKFMQMIGRGTRLCEGVLDGKDKTHFLIFDYCANFEYFGSNPEGDKTANGKNLSQKLFDVRLDILVELQKYEHQIVDINKAYYDKLRPELFGKVQEIKRNSARISVREQMAYVDKYNDYEKWSHLSLLEKKEMQLHLTPLVDSDADENKNSLAFDLKFMDIELSVLSVGGFTAKAHKQVERVRRISKVLLDTAAGVADVMAKSQTLLELVSVEFWEHPTIDKLEQYRLEVRDLLQYIETRKNPVTIDLIDTVDDDEYSGDGLIDIRTYKEKVLDYLAAHTDNETIRKIQNLQPINAQDVQELERILWQELGTKEDYEQTTEIDNLAAFIRSIVGIEQEAVNEKFGEFLSGNILNSQQQEFVKSIIDYVRENGDIQAEDLIEKSPFDSYDIVELFGANITVITSIIHAMHNSIVAA